jgi:uncharacterized repeat protein (TIGR01451 family)
MIVVVFLQASGTTCSPSSAVTSPFALVLIVQTESPFYGFGEVVKIRGNLTDTNGTAIQGARIAVEVRDPRNNTFFIDIVFTSIIGIFEDSFRLDKNAILGDYYVYGTANAIGYPATTDQTAFMVVTVANLSEKTFIASDLNETVLLQNATINNAEVQGDLSGALSFTSFEMVKIATGSFAGKGFSKGTWDATLEGISYKGEWRGAFYFVPSDRRICLKGAVSGEMTGVAEGYVSESIAQSGVYDRYLSTWKIGRLGTAIFSTTLNLNGTLVYHGYSEFPSTGLDVLQTSIEGSASGHYNCSLSSILTQIRVSANSPFIGEGFSIISYSSNYGMGEGWTYDRLTSPGTVELKGFLTSPLYGVLHATLNETKLPRTLHLYIERVDLGLPPMADLELRIWGPESVSPGQRITYAIELRNDGLKSAENVTVVNRFPWAVDYLSSTGDSLYKDYFREVNWCLDVPAKSKVDLATQGTVKWGLAGNTLLASFVDVQEAWDVETDQAMRTEYEIVQSNETYSRVKAVVHNQIETSTTFWETSTVRVPEWKEPTVEVNDLPDDMREMLTKLVFITPFPGSPSNIYYEVGVKLVENAGAVDRFLGFFNRLPGYIDKTAKFELDQDQANNWYQNGQIKEEDWKALRYIDTAGYLVQTVVKELAASLPIIGKFVNSVTWDGPFAGFIEHNRMNAIASANLDLYFELHDGVHKSRIMVARDPNLKCGPEGYVSSGQTLNYTVEYENEGEGIAFGVYVTDILDVDLDDSTLEISPVVSKTNGSVIADPGTHNPSTRTITWLVGEVGPNEGGVANFSAKVRNDAPEGTEIINSAVVYFPSVPETTRTNTIVSVVGQPNIAVKDLTPFETSAKRGSLLYLNATVANEGYFAETVNTTLYANSTTIGSQNITLTGRSENDIIFVWNTTNFQIGNYTISAYAEPVSGETYTADNSFVDSWVTIVSLVGDITGPDGFPDGECDIRDVSLVARNFGLTVPPAPANCDLTGPTAGVPDGEIDIRDVSLVAKHFGEHYP